LDLDRIYSKGFCFRIARTAWCDPWTGGRSAEHGHGFFSAMLLLRHRAALRQLHAPSCERAVGLDQGPSSSKGPLPAIGALVTVRRQRGGIAGFLLDAAGMLISGGAKFVRRRLGPAERPDPKKGPKSGLGRPLASGCHHALHGRVARRKRCSGFFFRAWRSAGKGKMFRTVHCRAKRRKAIRGAQSKSGLLRRRPSTTVAFSRRVLTYPWGNMIRRSWNVGQRRFLPEPACTVGGPFDS